MSFCVNIKSPQFKETAKRLDISDGQLELIAHEYINLVSNPDSFPSDEFIRSRFEGISELNAPQKVVELWNKMYSVPKVFSDYPSFRAARDKAIRYFGDKAVGTRVTQDGKLVLNVAKPNEKSSEFDLPSQSQVRERQKDTDFVSESIKERFTKTGLKIGNTYTGAEAKEAYFNLVGNNSPYTKLADTVFSLIDKFGIHLKVVDSLGAGIGGVWTTGSREFRVAAYNMFSDHILLHEAIHGVTVYYANAERETLPKNIQAALLELEKCYREIKDVNAFRALFLGVYGLSSFKEFIAELSNPEFREIIRDYDRPNSIPEERKRNFFQRIIDAVAKLLGITKSYKNVETTVYQALKTLLTDYSVPKFNRSERESARILKLLEDPTLTKVELPPIEVEGIKIAGSRGIIKNFSFSQVGEVKDPSRWDNRVIMVTVGGDETIAVSIVPGSTTIKPDGIECTIVPLKPNDIAAGLYEFTSDEFGLYATPLASSSFERVSIAYNDLAAEDVAEYHHGETFLTEKGKYTLGRVFADKIKNSGKVISPYTVLKHGTSSFSVAQVEGSLFKEIFNLAHKVLYKGDLVDLHDNYDDARCYLADNGLCGFAIEPSGNLISVFNISPSINRGFVVAAAQYILDQGATHLDAYSTKTADLAKLYEKALGFHPVARMDFNEAFDKSGIGKYYENPDVVFMTKEAAPERHFDKDSYDEAKQYQQDVLNGITKSTMPAANYTLHSGGAVQSDSYWEDAGKPYGLGKANHYYHGVKTPRGNVIQSEEDFREGLVKVREAALAMGRAWVDRYANLLARNWNQVKYSDAIYAVSSIVRAGEKNRKGYLVKSLQVDGGTGYAVQMAINEGKPVHVFDQRTNQWFEYSYAQRDFVVTDTPTLTPNFAGIGTSTALTEAGKKAIRDVYAKTFGEAKVQDTFEVSTAGDELGKKFSAFNAIFDDGTIIDGVDVSGKSIEYVYQNVIKKSGKGQPPAQDSRLYNPNLKTKAEQEEFSYQDAYLPLWKEWARQNPELIEQLREASKGKTLTDRFATTAVNQARALTEILANGVEAPKVEEVFHSKSNSLVGQINNLLNSGLLATEVRDEANKIMDWLSDQLTQYLENPELVWDKYYSKQPESGKQAMIDKISKMSRQELLGMLTVDGVLKYYSEEVLSRTAENAERFLSFDDDFLDKLDIIKDNLKGLVQLGYTRFLEREGFGIKLSEGSETMFDVTETPTAEQSDPDNTNGENDPDGNSEETGNQQEHWQIESRTRAILDNASAIVKQALANCYILEDNGKVKEDGTPDYDIKTDALGRNERMSQINATRSIAKWTQGALSVQDMIAKLSEKEKENPWVSQIINRLKDTSGKEADFQSQFFTVFNKHFQPYSVVIRNADGTYRTSQVNAHPALDDAMSAIKVQFRLGKLPLFNSEGVDVRNLDNFKAMRDTLDGFKKITESDRADVVSLVGEILQAVGLPQPEDAINRVLNNNVKNVIVIAMTNIAEKLTAEIGNKTYDPFAFKNKNSIGGFVQNLIRPFTNALEDVMVSSVYDSGKMYQSYITPSWTTKLFQKMHLDEKNFQKFILNEFATTEWFVKGVNLLADVPATQLAKMSEDQKDEARAQYIKDHASEIVRNPWLKEILNMDEKTRQEAFVHRVQLNFNKSNYMRGMNDLEYAMSVFTEFYTDANKNFRGKKFGYYRLPMLSNKPSNEFIRFVRYSGATALAEITNGFLDIFNQELSRIQTVTMRNLKKGDEGFIKNFDERGREFQFLDYLNEHLVGEKKNGALGKLLQDKIAGKEIDEKALIDLVRDEIKSHLETKANALVAQYKENGLFEALKSVENVGSTDDEVTRAIKEFSWNDTFAQANILELLITDKAFYGGEEDLQKRLAQVHSPGLRGNWQATDYNGNPVSDGKLRVVKIADYAGKDVVLNTIANLEEVFDRKIAEAEPSMKPQWEALKESIIDAYKDVNVVDGQAFVSPTAYRKKAIAFGEWSQDAEDTYQALLRGEYNLASLKSVFNPRKPFTYGKVNKPVSTNPNLDTPIKTLNYGVQYKDSEYLLIMADAILRGENTGRPNLLGALFDVMEETAKTNPTAGVDFIVFDSGVKAGLSGAISISDLVENPDGRDIAFSRIWNTILNQDGSYNEAYVDVLNAEDYANQQTVPEHFMEHGGLQWGSQIRAIMPSDLESTFMGQPVEYEFYDDAQGKWVKMDKQGIRNEWEKTTAAMINESVETLKEELGLNNTAYSQKDRNIILSKILQKEILSNARYGVDLLLACSVDEEGNFRIPLGDPIQSKRVEQLINSIIKNRINKQKVEGGTLVEVTNFGTSKRLERRYKDKDGNLLKSKKEYLAEGHTEAEFKQYVKDNQAGIAYDECYAPAWAREVFENFVDEKGNIDVESIEMLDPDLLKMFGYRIPTEEKYSTAPYKIIGFLPKEAGDGFMQPWETTVTDGSDFDVDKKNLMRMVINLKSKIMSKKAFAEDRGITDEDQLNKEYSSYRRVNSPTASNILKRIGEGGSHTLTAAEETEAKAWIENTKEKKVNKAKSTRERLDERALEKYNRDYDRIVSPLEKRYNELSEKEDLSAKEERDMLKLDRKIEREIAKLDRQLEEAKAQNEKNYNESISQIESDMKGIEEEHRSNILRDKKINAIQSVLDEGIFRDSSTIPQNKRKLFLAIKKAYLDMVYETSKPTSGRGYLNNKMFNMQWAIATNASTADKMLNPGNFDVQKRMGYMAAAYRLGNHTWEQLQAMSIKELKNLVFTNKNLMEFDVQTQFYKQNSVAGQILGIFAVARSAHAIFEGRNYGVLVDDTFTIAGMEFGGMMVLDKMKDRSGVNLIGKTLGSLVGASADAVKDPVLNFMNINKETVNVLNAALRLGMDFDSIALLLSSKAITNLLNDYYKNSLSKRVSLSKAVKQRLAKLEESKTIDGTELSNQELTTEEMIDGIKDVNEILEYKTLKAFQRLSAIASTINPLTNVSRLNSVASAVGPTHIDSIMSKRKFDSEMKGLVKIGENGMFEDLNIDTVFSDIPSLQAFYEAYNIVFGVPGQNRGLFAELGITTASEQFNSVLDAIPEDMEFTLYNNKKLLSSLADFFQSYLLVQSKVAKVDNMTHYVKNFAKWFTEQGFKTKYANNPFIQAIQTDVVSKQGQEDRYFLKIETTGMEQSEKDALSAGWIQLEKEDPRLSHFLFFYNFWRGGIGFNPKTFMGLVPLQVKEKIGGYLNTYRNLPSVVGTDVFDQWVRNNWGNDELVPRVYKIPLLADGTMVAQGNNYFKVANSPYVKMRVGDRDVLFRRTDNYDADAKKAVYEQVTPLGNNREYFEAFPSDVANAIPQTQTFYAEKATVESDQLETVEDNPNDVVETDAETAQALTEFVDQLVGDPNRTAELQEMALEEAFEDLTKDLELKEDSGKFDEMMDEFC